MGVKDAAIEQTLVAIRQRVRERYGLTADGEEAPPAEARSALSEAMDLAHISAHTPILWETPLVGRGLALTRRAVRLLLRWYINPIVDQQNDFNAAVVRVLAELSAEQDRLRAAIEELAAAERTQSAESDDTGAS